MKQTSIEWLFEKLWEEPKDKLTWFSILEQAKEMHGQEMAQLPQQEISDNSPKEENKTSYGEISDEEIEKFADEELGTIRTDFDFGVIQGMKWYREQLKQL
jgi:hypothetical protein